MDSRVLEIGALRKGCQSSRREIGDVEKETDGQAQEIGCGPSKTPRGVHYGQLLFKDRPGGFANVDSSCKCFPVSGSDAGRDPVFYQTGLQFGGLMSTDPLRLLRRNDVIARMRMFALVVGLLLAPALLSAHHAWPVNMSKLVTVKGSVTEIHWGNPHPMFALEVRGENGTIDEWSVGGPAIVRMTAHGWTKDTLKIGQVITAIGYQYSDGSKILRIEKVVLADGKELLVYAGGSGS